MKKKVTLRDIGKRLGLSAMTVSLALRDHPRIPESTRERVHAAIRELDYKPNQVARALATGRSNLIGVIVPNSSDPYYAEVIRAIEDAASQAGVTCTGHTVEALHPWEAILDHAKSQQCDLIVMASHGRRGVAALLLGSETSRVLIHSEIPVLVVK